MKKVFVYIGSAFSLLLNNVCFAAEKFEILPDLPDALAQAANANTVSKGTTTALATSSVGHEPTIISVVLSLAFVILLIYATGIIYTKLNKSGLKLMQKQKGMDLARSQATVISTTQLGNSKTLHVVELDGKRMLIGASTASIQLIKDLGTFSENVETEDYSNIEIPNIKIPKIEIPKIEIPSLKLSKIITKVHKELDLSDSSTADDAQDEISDDKDVIIDTLFPDKDSHIYNDSSSDQMEHKVNPDEYALYMKYIK